MTKTTIALLVIWLIQSALCLSNNNRTIITRENQESFGTKLTVNVSQNQSTGRYIFTISIPANDPVLTHVYNCFLIIATSTNLSTYELNAPLRLSTHTDGTKSALFSIVSDLIPKAYISIEHRGGFGPLSSESESVYLKVGTYVEKAKKPIRGHGKRSRTRRSS